MSARVHRAREEPRARDRRSVKVDVHAIRNRRRCRKNGKCRAASADRAFTHKKYEKRRSVSPFIPLHGCFNAISLARRGVDRRSESSLVLSAAPFGGLPLWCPACTVLFGTASASPRCFWRNNMVTVGIFGGLVIVGYAISRLRRNKTTRVPSLLH